MNMDFNQKYDMLQETINNYIDSIIPKEYKSIGRILDSMRYSLFAGGKRLRPILMLAVGEVFNAQVKDLLPFCAGIEMIHTYSLIHDDLPAMDNDDYRRGRLTNHKVYGEALAILSGDGLLNYAFEHMLSYCSIRNEERFIRAAYEIAKSSGIYGMIGGQVIDIENTGKLLCRDVLDSMYEGKTGALISASIKCGAILSGAGYDDIERLSGYAHDLGLAFQIIDDMLDVIGDEARMGKKTGSDANNGKTTYISICGLDESRNIARSLSNSALKKIEFYQEKAAFLSKLTHFLLHRDY